MGVPPSQIPPEPNIPSRPSQEEPQPVSRTQHEFRSSSAKSGDDDVSKLIDKAADEIKDMIKDKLKELIKKNPKDLKNRLGEELSNEKKKLEKELEGIVAMLQGAENVKMTPQELSMLKELAKIPAAELRTNVNQIFGLIQKYCDRLLVSVAGGRPSLLVDLKAEANVPRFFQGTQMMLTQTDAGLVVNFSNFTSPVQERGAVFAIEQNREALSALMANLEAKNINLSELNIGGRSILLPGVEAAKAESIQAPEEGREARQREQRGGGGGAGREGGEEGEPRR